VPTEPTVDPESIAAAREAIQQTRGADQAPGERGPDWAAADADAHPDDLDADHQGMSTAELLQRELGAQMIEEIKHPS
jgi:DNA polymerase III subunit gamma/tau